MRAESMPELLGNKQAVILDVREDDEFRYDGHIQGAIHIPLQQLPQRLAELDKKTTYHVVCWSGARSQVACNFLANQGYDVINVMGGMSAYRGPLNYEM